MSKYHLLLFMSKNTAKIIKIISNCKSIFHKSYFAESTNFLPRIFLHNLSDNFKLLIQEDDIMHFCRQKAPLNGGPLCAEYFMKLKQQTKS